MKNFIKTINEFINENNLNEAYSVDVRWAKKDLVDFDRMHKNPTEKDFQDLAKSIAKNLNKNIVGQDLENAAEYLDIVWSDEEKFPKREHSNIIGDFVDQFITESEDTNQTLYESAAEKSCEKILKEFVKTHKGKTPYYEQFGEIIEKAEVAMGITLSDKEKEFMLTMITDRWEMSNDNYDSYDIKNIIKWFASYK